MNPLRFLASRPVAAVRALLPALLALVPAAAYGAFGYSDNGSAYVVDTGAGLVFQVSKSSGDLTSIQYNGTEYVATSGKFSQLSSGLGTATVTPSTDGATYVMMTLQTGTAGTADPDMTHYLIVRNGINTIYMATLPGQEPTVGELRWITRLNSSLIGNGPVPSDTRGSVSGVENNPADVVLMSDGTTRSKYYGDDLTHGKDRAMDLTYTGATGPGIGCWMVFGNRESSSGGPFFRDIENQDGGDQEIYNYMNSGHNQTEDNRLGVLHGPYALVFTSGAPPSLPVDFSWMDSLNLAGWVPASGRGAVSGTATGIGAGFQGVVGFANAAAQYWSVIHADGTYTCPGMKPGTYSATLYQGELGVATGSVTVTAGASAPLNLSYVPPTNPVIFQIGAWDGTPAGLMNADKMIAMHPSDVRMSPWAPTTFVVGQDSPAAKFPAIQMRGADTPTKIQFKLAANQVTALTLKIGITCAYNNGRPQVSIGSFTSADPGASTQPNSRSFTIGTYRGNNTTFTFTIPASALVAGVNTLTITPISGSSDLSPWLSAGWVYDSVELDGPVGTPVVTYVGGSSPLVVSGTSEPGRAITVMMDSSTPLGTATADANGNWTLDYSGTVPPGSHVFTAVASDANGNSSPASATFPVDGDLATPAILQAQGTFGTYPNGATTADNTVTLSGTAAPNASLTLTQVGVGTIGTATADASGNWSFDDTATALPQGANRFFATATSGANSSPSSAVFTLQIQGAPFVAVQRETPAGETVSNTLASVTWNVTFASPVSGVTPSAFAVATVSGSAAGTVSAVSAGSGTSFEVTVSNLAGSGQIRLDLVAGSGVVDASNQPVPAFHAGEPYNLIAPSTGNGTWVSAAAAGSWSDIGNWLNAIIPDGAADSASFATLDLPGDVTVHLDRPRTVNSASFGDTDPGTPGAWLIDDNGSTANVLTLGGSAPTLTVGALGTGAAAAITAPLAGTAGLTKAGAGTLVLGASEAVSGNLTISGGVLQLGADAALNLGSGAVNLSATGTQLQVNGGALATTGAVSSQGKLVISGGSATLGKFATSTDFGATLELDSGTLNVGDVNVLRNSGSSPDQTTGFLVKGGTATATTIEMGSKNSYGSMNVSGGSLTATGTVTLGNQQTAGRGGTLTVSGTGTFIATDAAEGVLLCRTNGSNANNVGTATFSGGTSLVQKFTLGFDSTVTAGSATVTVNGGALYLGSGGIVKNGASGLATNLNFSGGQIGATADWGTSLNVNLPNGGNIAFTAADPGGNPFDITLAGVVGGAGGLTKSGSGTLVLSAANTYSGATAVNAGTLDLTGSLGASSAGLAVNASGVLEGTGTANQAVTLNSGGALTPGQGGSIGTLSAASLTWNSGGVVAETLGASGSSGLVALSGALTKGAPAGTYSFAFAAGTGFAAGNTYTVATFGSTNFSAADFTATGLPAGTGAFFILNGSSLQIQIQAPPSLTGPASANAAYGAAFTYTATAAGLPATLSASGLPPGLSFDPATGVISGTPTAAGVFTVTLSAANSAGTASSTLTIDIGIAAFVRHGLTVNGELDGSAEVMLGENDTLNGGAMISGDLLVPGTPAVVLNGHPTYGSTVDQGGSASPANYSVTLNGSSVLRHVERRTDSGAMPAVAAPPAPAGTRNVTLNSSGQSPGDFTTVNNLTLNGNVGAVAVPAGTYGNFTANGGSSFVLGTAGASQPSAYNLQGLTINGNAQLQVVGPVVVTLPSGVTFNGSAGDPAHPEWLLLQTANGGVTINGRVSVNGSVIAPHGQVTVNGTLNGSSASDTLVINGQGVVSPPSP